MSGTLPTSPSFSTATLKHNQPTIFSTSESGKSQSRIVAGHLWEIMAEYAPMTRAEFAPIYAFAISQRGRLGSFTMSLPQFNTPQGIATGTPLVFGAHSAGDSSILTYGWTGSQTGIMKAGDLIQFAGHSKVYMVTADANSDVGGNSIILIEPPLIEDVANTESVTVSNIQFTVAFKNKIQEFKTYNPSLQKFALDLIEFIA